MNLLFCLTQEEQQRIISILSSILEDDQLRSFYNNASLEDQKVLDETKEGLDEVYELLTQRKYLIN